MSEFNICFDSAVYQRALNHLKSVGLVANDLSYETQSLKDHPQTQYGCVQGKNPIVVELKQIPKGPFIKQGSKEGLYVGDGGKAYRIVYPESMLRGVKIVMGQDVEANDPIDKVAVNGLKLLYQCEQKNDYTCSGKVVAGLQVQKIAAQNEIAETEKMQMNQAIVKGKQYIERAKRVIALSVEQDKGPGGINPKDLQSILWKYSSEINATPTTLSEAKSFLRNAEMLLEEILLDDSGFKTINERPVASGCMGNKYFDPIKPSCSDGQSGYSGELQSVGCSDIGFDATHWLSSGGCYTPSKTPSETINDLVGPGGRL